MISVLRVHYDLYIENVDGKVQAESASFYECNKLRITRK